MAHELSDTLIIKQTRNAARFFTENRHISWVLLVGTIIWGVFSYFAMPKRKDPEIPIRVAVAVCRWPGISADKVEQLVTRKMEQKIAENSKVEKIDSVTRTSVSIIYIWLREGTQDIGLQFDDIKLKLDGIHDLPQGAGPIEFLKDFGDTAALTLTVASPKADPVDIALRAEAIRQSIENVRRDAGGDGERATVVVCLPRSVNTRPLDRYLGIFAGEAKERKLARDVRTIQGPGFAGLDGVYGPDDAGILEAFRTIRRERLRASEMHPDLWEPVVIRNPADAQRKLTEGAGDKYSYADLEQFTDLMARTLQTVPLVSKVERFGLLRERICLDYSQERLASYGVQPSAIRAILNARNIDLPGGVFEVEGKNLVADPSGEFKNENEIGDVLVTATASGTPVYLRDLVDISREYESPARFLNFFNWRDAAGHWQRTRCITLAVQMRSGGQIGEFGETADAALSSVAETPPATTSWSPGSPTSRCRWRKASGCS